MEYRGCTWAEVDLTALRNNYKAIEANFAAGRAILSIVKTDAYGHGAVRVAQELEKMGSQGFCVSSILEARELRQAGIVRPILILGYTPAQLAPELARMDIQQCVFSLDYARALSLEAQKEAVCVKVHLKLDTGMGRIGFDCRSDSQPGLVDAMQVRALPNLQVTGVFMHFATADGEDAQDMAFAQDQARRFESAVAALTQAGCQFDYVHCCNSAATLVKPAIGSAIRPGIVLYGISPLDKPLPPEFKPVMSLYSTVSLVKTLAPGQSVSYGRTYVADRPRCIATVCAGYGDGVPRLLSGKGHVLIHGKRAPIVGRVCMDHFCVDVTEVGPVETGDTVTIFGPDLPVQEVAELAQTIHYEILCGISKRVPRIYK